MTRSRYAKALDKTLPPLGFNRQKDDWIRVRGDIWECVSRLSGRFAGGVCATLMTKDLATERLYLEIFAGRGFIGMPWGANIQAGDLIGRRDSWWPTDDPAGPTEMVDAILRHGLPWFDRVRSLEQQAKLWYGRETALSERGYYKHSLIGLALTLYRMGELDEALKVTNKPVPRTAIPSSVQDVALVRAWLERQRRKSLD